MGVPTISRDMIGHTASFRKMSEFCQTNASSVSRPFERKSSDRECLQTNLIRSLAEIGCQDLMGCGDLVMESG
jgi:hypothetical protein